MNLKKFAVRSANGSLMLRAAGIVRIAIILNFSTARAIRLGILLKHAADVLAVIINGVGQVV